MNDEHATVNSYRFYDELPGSGSNYYRVRTIYTNGTFKYSSVAIVNTGNLGSAAVTLMSNPAKGTIVLM